MSELKGVDMKLVCISDKVDGTTKGKQYDVIDINSAITGLIIISDDTGFANLYKNSDFVDLKKWRNMVIEDIIDEI